MHKRRLKVARLSLPSLLSSDAHGAADSAATSVSQLSSLNALDFGSNRDDAAPQTGACFRAGAARASRGPTWSRRRRPLQSREPPGSGTCSAVFEELGAKRRFRGFRAVNRKPLTETLLLHIGMLEVGRCHCSQDCFTGGFQGGGHSQLASHGVEDNRRNQTRAAASPVFCCSSLSLEIQWL